MPQSMHYRGMSLSRALEDMSWSHGQHGSRHLSYVEVRLLERAAALLERAGLGESITGLLEEARYFEDSRVNLATERALAYQEAPVWPAFLQVDERGTSES
jgi:hypothetical protein